MSSIVRFRIPQGDRPSLDEIRHQAAGRAGLTTLTEVMQRCWDPRPCKRPTAYECTTVTEELYKMHKRSVIDVVHEMLKKLDQNEEERITEFVEGLSIVQHEAGAHGKNFCDVPTGHPPIQEMAGGLIANELNNLRIEDVSEMDQACSSPDYKMRTSSVHPIQSSTSSPLTQRSPQNRAAKHSEDGLKKHLLPQYQRQFSNPDTSSFQFPSQPRINMHLNNVTGFQSGNNNTMYICHSGPLERKRHPTAPSTYHSPQH